jgi:hypothetical protein
MKVTKMTIKFKNEIFRWLGLTTTWVKREGDRKRKSRRDRQSGCSECPLPSQTISQNVHSATGSGFWKCV